MNFIGLILFLNVVTSSYNQKFETEIFRRKRSNFTFIKDIIDTNRNSNNITHTERGYTAFRFQTPFGFKGNKKWLIERVTNKHYEMINLLWQKTKIFVDVDYSNLTCKATTTEKTRIISDHVTRAARYSIQQPLKTTILRKMLRTRTPSYIEFNYLEQTDGHKEQKQSSNFILQNTANDNKLNPDRKKTHKFFVSTLFKVHVNNVSRQQRTKKSQQMKLNGKSGQNTDLSTVPNNLKRKTSLTVPSTPYPKPKYDNEKQQINYLIKQSFNISHLSTPFPMITKNNVNKKNTLKNTSKLSFNMYSNGFLNSRSDLNNSDVVSTTPSTAYDKIKFFELYDSNTPEWLYVQNNVSNINYISDNESRISYKNNRIVLDHVNEDTGHEHDKKIAKFVKKHIQNMDGKEDKTENKTDVFTYFSRPGVKISSQITQTSHFQMHSNLSRPAIWTEYPFVAVYIYEPSQVRCDAASISPHWLLAAASCLSRHHKDLHGGSLSAYVTYCSEDWRYPSVLSYVKRTLIHPRYHPRETSRRHLFNAGVIQVVNSMEDTCIDWAPVSLMSHYFTADQEGSVATAVGWGLDRYDKIDANTEIQKNPLMVYESFVYSQSCPGNFEYRLAKTSAEDSIRNVYCVLLPPYIAEENDTVHGALLLIGGKLLALYLQEERRAWGVQSAQYTGVWRLVPWIAESAREIDDLYTFRLEI